MYVDSKNYQYTIEHEDQNNLLGKSIYSHMPRSNFTAMNNRDASYQDNVSTKKRVYSNNGFRSLNYNSQTINNNSHIFHSPGINSDKHKIEMENSMNHLSFTAPYKVRTQSRLNENIYDDNPGMLPNIRTKQV